MQSKDLEGLRQTLNNCTFQNRTLFSFYFLVFLKIKNEVAYNQNAVNTQGGDMTVKDKYISI